jgi:5-methylcytosine-specific restriction endonuclease McrA
VIVDHIVPHKGDQTLFWDRANWRPMAKACHDSKTAREDGGFGNPRRQAEGLKLVGGRVGSGRGGGRAGAGG